jgi:hypothetical protein
MINEQDNMKSSKIRRGQIQAMLAVSLFMIISMQTATGHLYKAGLSQYSRLILMIAECLCGKLTSPSL